MVHILSTRLTDYAQHTHTLYYKHLAIQIVHSLRTNTNKKITEIQCFISDFLSHILTMLQCIVSDTVNKFSHFCSKQQNVMHVCIIAVCLPLLRGSELPLFPQMLYPEKQKAKENTLKHMIMYMNTHMHKNARNIFSTPT